MNPESFLGISPVQKEVFLSHKLQGHTYEEDDPSLRNCENQLSHPSLSHVEQECQESLIQGKINIQQNSNKGLEYL